MIRYNKRIELKQHRNGEWKILTDRGDEYQTQLIVNNPGPLTYWWQQQHHSPLREWQKDAVIKDSWWILGPLELYLVYKKGQGYSQPHDIALARYSRNDIWILSTEENTWILPATRGDQMFVRELALGSINQADVRQKFYELLREIKQALQ